ncbi:MAG: hypothetical protein LH615_07545 [Ferruginibacter sp.]|nr:hypothetical protein [Ferruginibacter sp.]
MLYTILFTGHMIDKDKRAKPRFEAAKENEVMQAMQKQIIQEKGVAKNNIRGIASGACGGDILFHELCKEYKIPTEVYLAMPENEFKKASVSFAGKKWDDRFDELVKKLPVSILPASTENNKENVWEQTNLWMLKKGLENGGENMSLIALWDGESGDGTGGTEHMINIAKEKGARINIIDIKKI